MREIILITNFNYGFEEFLEILMQNGFNPKTFGEKNDYEIVIKLNNEIFGNTVQIEAAPGMPEIYNHDEMEYIQKIIPSPCYFFIHFKNIEDVKVIAKHIADRNDVLIDDDFGLILPGNEFIKKCQNNPNWDWAKN